MRHRWIFRAPRILHSIAILCDAIYRRPHLYVFLFGRMLLIAAYYFPNDHPDARNAKVHGPNWTERELVRQAPPFFLDICNR